MKITFTDQFWLSFGAIIDFIASDSEARADKFADDMLLFKVLLLCQKSTAKTSFWVMKTQEI